MEDNFIIQTDFYKDGHWAMEKQGTEHVSSYMAPRVGATHDWTTMFGLQYYLEKYLAGVRITHDSIGEAYDLHKAMAMQENFNWKMWERILSVHGGLLPLRILAWDEGCRVPVGFPAFTIINTDPRCAALTNHVESLLAKIWYPMTVATVSGHVVASCKKFVQQTGGPEGAWLYMLHDFGYRGVSSEESARIGGAAHLIHSQGTDTKVALPWLRKYYGAGYQGLGGSVAASEHSIMTQGGPQEEVAIALNIVKNHPNQIVSLVADSYNYYDFVDAMISHQAYVDEHGVRLVIRPDSTTPNHKTPASLVLWTLQRMKAKMPTTTTQTGHVVTHYGCLWGDGIGPDGVENILGNATLDGFAAHNLVFGMGGGLLQKVHRDTERFAVKASAQCVDGKWGNLVKDPLDQSKKSLSGRMQVVDICGYPQIVPENQWEAHHSSVRLHPVFENGVILRKQTFADIRAKARSY